MTYQGIKYGLNWVRLGETFCFSCYPLTTKADSKFNVGLVLVVTFDKKINTKLTFVQVMKNKCLQVN